jgi:hypothetical protein
MTAMEVIELKTINRLWGYEKLDVCIDSIKWKRQSGIQESKICECYGDNYVKTVSLGVT